MRDPTSPSSWEKADFGSSSESTIRTETRRDPGPIGSALASMGPDAYFSPGGVGSASSELTWAPGGAEPGPEVAVRSFSLLSSHPATPRRQRARAASFIDRKKIGAIVINLVELLSPECRGMGQGPRRVKRPGRPASLGTADILI